MSAGDMIPFSPPFFGPEEEAEVLDSIRTGWITTGPKVKEFERRVAAYVGASQGVATFSCTDALQLSLRVLGVGPGDEVLTTPYTFPSTSQVICHEGARPVFADVEPDTFNLDPARIEVAVTAKTKAILPVHYAGHPCDMDPILDLARRKGLAVLEDAAHALGSKYKGRSIGTLSDITCFSFYATKNLSTAEGGMAVLGDEAKAKRMRQLTMYGISDAREIWQDRYKKGGGIHFDVYELGYKCNMTDICASLGLHQLAKLDRFNADRAAFAAIYNDMLGKCDLVDLPLIKPYATTNWHLYPIRLRLEALSVDRDEVVLRLRGRNVGTSVLWRPLHFHTYYKNLLGCREGDYPVAEELFHRSLCLPISPKLGADRIRRAATIVRETLEECRR